MYQLSSYKPRKVPVSLANLAARKTEKDHEDADNQVVPSSARGRSGENPRRSDYQSAKESVDIAHRSTHVRESDDGERHDQRADEMVAMRRSAGAAKKGGRKHQPNTQSSSYE